MESYARLKMTKRVIRVMNCGNFLEFRHYQDKTMKLHSANFCKVRLCPMCSWRRSLKIFGQVSAIMHELDKTKEYDYNFLTLTTRNVHHEDLSDSIDLLYKAWNKLSKRKRFKNSIHGFFKALEVTYNYKEDTWHPHLHIIQVVRKDYYKRKDLYIPQKEWSELWQKSLQVDYTPIIDIRKVRGRKGQDKSSAVSETAKYSVKDKDYIIADIWNEIDEKRTDKNVKTLDAALANRRLASFGGIMAELHKKLNLDDSEDGNLINTHNDEDLHEELDYIIKRYRWDIGFQQYKEVE